MADSKLLITTALSTPGLRPFCSIRSFAIELARRGRGAEAICFLSYHFFHSWYASGSECKKKRVLRAVWNAIDVWEERRFLERLRASMQLVADAEELEWEEEVEPGTIYQEAEYVHHSEVVDERNSAKVMGRCEALVNLMTMKDGKLEEDYFLAIEEMLSALMGK